jgi:precorrin-2/cobalt-factor-2 C20-methyltransferase
MIYLVGMGPGDSCYITPQARDTVEKASRVYGFPKHLEVLGIKGERAHNISGRIQTFTQEIKTIDPDEDIAVLVAGDPTVFSLSRRILGQFESKRIKIIPGLGSFQILCSALQLQTPLPEQFSVHGRTLKNLESRLHQDKALVVYTDMDNTAQAIAGLMLDMGKPHWRFVIGSKLGSSDEEFYEAPVSEIALGVPERFNKLNLCYLAPLKAESEAAKLFGIGIGPGDPELLTIKALKTLEQSDLILCPRARIKDSSLARSIIEKAAGYDLPIREIEYPMTLDNDSHEQAWKENALDCLKELKQGKTVSFVTLGDTSIYSTFSYFLEAVLKEYKELDWEIIPGISSIQLGASLTGQALVLGKESCVLLPMPEDVKRLDSFIDDHASLILMKVIRKIPELKAYLKEKGLEESSSLIHRAGLPEEKVIKGFQNVEDSQSGALSIVIIKTGRNL